MSVSSLSNSAISFNNVILEGSLITIIIHLIHTDLTIHFSTPILPRTFVREKRKRPCSSAGHKTDRQCGALCHAVGLAYDPKSWALESGHREKRKQPFSSDRHKTDQQSGALCHSVGLAYDPKSWLLKLDN